MIIYYGLKDKKLKAKPRSIAIGMFDGVHQGHQKILGHALTQARKKNLNLCVVTFNPHPAKILKPRGAGPKILMSLEHRLRLLESFGVDEVVVIAFSRRLAKVTHDHFLEHILIRLLGLRSLSVGEDFCFGKNALGNIDYLSHKSKEIGFNFYAAKHVLYKKTPISSTRIRREIEAGDLRSSSKMLGRPVSVSGTVVRGQGRGKSLGFPTANLNPHHEALPPAGVYSAYGFVGSQKLMAVVHIGERPTFTEKDPSVEAHFLKFDRNIYGRTVELFFIKRLRGIQKFPSSGALKSAIQKDIAQAFPSA